MVSCAQENVDRRNHRYSISSLIELSKFAFSPFDLSKFTYDAARAGVVPVLSDCVMSTRKSSMVSHPRETSYGSSESGKVIAVAEERILKPNRQPNIPPPAADQQRSEGFARFLKKHSSPTHNRVTAGGRIVPMEPKSPPRFCLSQYTSHSQDGSKNQSVRLEGTYGHAGSLQHEKEEKDGNLGLEHCSTHEISFYSDRLPSNIVAHHLASAASPTTTTALQVNKPANVPLMVQCMPMQLYGEPWRGYGSLTGTNPTWPEAAAIAPTWGYEQHGPSQTSTHDPNSMQQLLQAWEQHYVELNQQMKNIDRHRAMHTLDRSLADQRRVIAQQRSDAKDTINEYRNMLGLQQHADPPRGDHMHGFNVDAPEYVPITSTCQAHSRGDKWMNEEKPEQRIYGGRRPIAIRAPPADTEARKLSRSHALVDEWGVNQAEAPLEIRRQQSHMSDVLEQKRGQLPASHISLSPLPRPDDLHNAESGNVKMDYTLDRDKKVTLASGTLAPFSNCIPLDLVDEQQQLIRAINMPKGTVSHVRLLDNRVISVHGQGLSLGMNLESLAPNQNATITPRHYAAQHSHTASMQSLPPNSENISLSHGAEASASKGLYGHRKAATDAFVSQLGTVDDIKRGDELDTLSLRTGYTALRERNRDDRFSVSRQNPLQDCNSKFYKGAENKPSIQAMNPPQSHNADGESFGYDERFVAKSYSSVSVQSVHATGHLPHNLDGPIDTSRAVLSQLAGGDRVRSPRLIRRQLGKTEGWYGPYCRAIMPSGVKNMSNPASS